MPTFVLNDETVVNSYGFRVLNAGGAFARFDTNPVMLNSHENTTEMTLGNWKNRVIEGFKLKGDTNFDSAMDSAKVVEGQVDRGFIKGCSMGLAISFDDDSWQKAPDGIWELTKWELMEASICAVPSNSGALALYNKATGELIAEDQFKLSFKNLSAKDLKLNNNPKMEKIILSTAAIAVLVGLNVTSADNVAEISAAIVQLNTKATNAEAKVTELQGKLDAQLKTQAEALVDAAILDEKVMAGERQEYVDSAIANFKLTSSLISKLPGKIGLNSRVVNHTAGATEVKSIDDFEKLSNEKKLAFKSEHPEEYKALFAK